MNKRQPQGQSSQPQDQSSVRLLDRKKMNYKNSFQKLTNMSKHAGTAERILPHIVVGLVLKKPRIVASVLNQIGGMKAEFSSLHNLFD